MACGVIKFSDRGRTILAHIFTGLSIIMFILSVLLVINSIYVTFVITPNVQTERAAIRLIFTVIAMLAMQLATYYMTGIFVCKKCHLEAYKKNSRYLLRIWTFSGYSSIFNVVVIGTMAAGVSNHLIRSMHYSMERGMRHYLDDTQWKKIIDTLQFNMQCCGYTSYKDWHNIAWMSASHVINSSEIIRHTFPLSGQHLYVPAVPWSCCKLDYYRQCFHDPIQQYQYVDDWPRLTAESVNNAGCMELLRQPIELSFLLFVLATYLLFFLQITLTIVSRYIYTSYKSAVILGDPFGVAPGWILDKSDFGYGDGPSVHEIMNRTRAHTSRSSTTDAEESDNDSAEFYTTAHHNDDDDDYRVSREDLMMR